MKPTRGRLLANSARITVPEFFNAFSATIHGSSALDGKRLGLAVSGGVDSMALATLCSDLSIAHLKYGLNFQALIINHNVREESKSVALKTEARLKRMGLSSRVIDLYWPNGLDPLQSTNFETVARDLRYAALGRACVEEGIRSLFLAHHADDQAETVLMRMVTGHKGPSLGGMKPVGDIPSCEGIYGAWRSGRPHREVFTEPGSRENREKAMAADGMLDYEGGGIIIYRPLLKFDKERLVATCVASGTNWAEDVTNEDVTLTPRNAIRHLLQRDRLPKALRKPSLLALSARMAQTEASRKEKVMSILRKCEFLMFDTRTGSLVIRLPTKLPEDTSEAAKARPGFARLQKWALATSLVRTLALLVTPAEKLRASVLQHPAEFIFPDLENREEHGGLQGEEQRQKNRIVTGNVDYQRAYWPLTEPRRSSGFANHKHPTHGIADDKFELDPEHVWILHRAKYPSAEQNLHNLSFPPTNNDGGSPRPFSPWHLWDGRFWIRIQNHTDTETFTVRPFREEDLKAFRRSVHGPARRRWEAFLNHVAPSKVRFTVPAIVSIVKDVENNTEREVFVALPSLGMAKNLERVRERVNWQIRYKRVDFEWVK